jgi:hypothetical protein
MSWHRLSRFFHLEGNLGALRYQVRCGVFELNALDTFAVGNALVAGPERKLLADSWASERSIALALHVWESEGGASIGTKG